MKIVFFIGSMQRGGAERVISILANEYASKGWDVEIALLLEEAVAYTLDERIRVVSLVGKSGSYLKNALFWLRGIRRYLKQTKPDRVVSFIGRINALVLTAALGLKVPVVVSERNDPKHDGRGRGMQAYCNLIYKSADAIVFQNQYEKSCFSRSLDKIGYVIPNPVSVQAVHEGKAFNRTVATAGRLVSQKNHAMLIDAVGAVRGEYPDVRCEIYGDGSLYDTLQTQIETSGLAETVSLKGNVSDVHQRLKDCGLFVMTSEFEGLSNALIEAMMMGLPCITTDYPGADELIEDGVNGIVVPRGDTEGLAEQIKRVFADDELRGRLADAARTSAEAYKKETVLGLWSDVIEK